MLERFGFVLIIQSADGDDDNDGNFDDGFNDYDDNDDVLVIFLLERFELVSRTEEFLKLDLAEVKNYIEMVDIIII